MTSTLIVRDATLAINGDRFRADDPVEHLRTRVAAVSDLDREFLEQCVQVLSASDGGDETDPAILEALFVLGISRPEILADMGMNHVVVGRRLAARVEADDEPEVALAVLEFLLEHDPDNRGVHRDHAALMRRLGMVQDLVERHLSAARQLMTNGKNAEAIELLREVLLLDRTRKDVARTIRDLRYAEVEKSTQRRRVGRNLLLLVLASVGVVWLVGRELRLREEYRGLLGDQQRSIESVRARLDLVEGFVERHPVWLGSFDALNERSRLRIELERLVAERAADVEKRDVELQKSREEAAWARERGRMRAQGEDYASAIAEFERALELGGPDWAHREQTLRDVEALREELEARR